MVAACRLSVAAGRVYFPDQGWNPSPCIGGAQSEPPDLQGSPSVKKFDLLTDVMILPLLSSSSPSSPLYPLQFSQCLMASGRKSQRKRRKRRKSTRKIRTQSLFSTAVTPVVIKVTTQRKKRKERLRRLSSHHLWNMPPKKEREK